MSYEFSEYILFLRGAQLYTNIWHQLAITVFTVLGVLQMDACKAFE